MAKKDNTNDGYETHTVDGYPAQDDFSAMSAYNWQRDKDTAAFFDPNRTPDPASTTDAARMSVIQAELDYCYSIARKYKGNATKQEIEGAKRRIAELEAEKAVILRRNTTIR